MPGPMELIILFAGLAVVVIFITLVVLGVLKLVKGKKNE